MREPGHVRIAVAAHRMGFMQGTILFKLNLADHALWGLPPSAAAVDAFNDAGPFPDPPAGLVDQNGQIQIPWDFILQS